MFHRHFKEEVSHSFLLDTIENLARSKRTQLISSDVSHTARGFFEKNSYQVIHPNQIEKDGVILVKSIL